MDVGMRENWEVSFYDALDAYMKWAKCIGPAAPYTDIKKVPDMLLKIVSEPYEHMRWDHVTVDVELALRPAVIMCSRMALNLGSWSAVLEKLEGYVYRDGTKTADYNSGEVFKYHYFRDPMMPLVLLRYKALRLKSLLNSSNEPKNESIMDTVVDFVAYALFTMASQCASRTEARTVA